MPKGVAKINYRSIQVNEAELEDFLKETKYSDDTKAALRLVLVKRRTYKEAGESVGVTRQRVFDRVKDCLTRMGAVASPSANG